MQDAIGNAQCLHTHADREGGGATKGVSSAALKATLCEYEQALLRLALPIVLKIYGAGQLLGTETPLASPAQCKTKLAMASSVLTCDAKFRMCNMTYSAERRYHAALLTR